MLKMLWFACGLFMGFTALSIGKASVPMKNRVTDDTAMYQKLSEISVKKQMKLDFDSDISQLSKLENRYHERLPSIARNPRLKGPMQRISQQKYRYSGNKKSR